MEKTQEKPKTATWIPVALVKSESSASGRWQSTCCGSGP